METKREIWIDWMRVAACFLVMVVHSTEPFYLGGDGTLIRTWPDAVWAAVFDCFARACVPMFVVASAYLQFPIHYSTGEFFRRRAVRLLIPFALWTVVYALAYGNPVENFKGLLLNFNYAAGHLWFVYMIAGLYLIMPMLSPWAEKVGRKELQAYLGIWLFTTLIPIVKGLVAGQDIPVQFGPLGIPMPATYPMWGEASWNAYGVFYYLSGFIGYMLLGLYFRKFVGQMSLKRTLAIAVPCLLVGYAICVEGFLRRVMQTSGGMFPVGGNVGMGAVWETTWFNDTVGVALMTIGSILLLRRINCSGGFYTKILLPISKASYGMYLCHMLVLGRISALLRNSLGTGYDGILGIWTTPVQITLTALTSFCIVAIISVLLQRIPKIGKFIIG